MSLLRFAPVPPGIGNAQQFFIFGFPVDTDQATQ